MPKASNNAVVPAEIPAGTWTIDPVHSSISFSVRHLMVSRVRGTLGTFSGEITVSSEGTPSVSAEIEVSSLDTGNDQRDAHLKSVEFFDVEQHPTATFTATGVRADGSGYALDGAFTLKGITKPISIGLEFNGINPGMGHGAVAGFQASVILNRKDFGIDINMPLGNRRRCLGRQGYRHAGRRSGEDGVTKTDEVSWTTVEGMAEQSNAVQISHPPDALLRVVNPT